MFTTFTNYTALALPVTVLVVFVVLVLAARPDRDDQGNGLYATYLAFVGVAALYGLLIFSATAATAIGDQVVVDQANRSANGVTADIAFGSVISPFGDSSDGGNAEEQTAVLGTILTVGAGFVLAFHLRRFGELAASPGFPASAAERVDSAYRGTVAVLAVLVGLGAFGFAGVAAYALIDPATFGNDHPHINDLAVVRLVVYGALLGASVLIFRAHFWTIRESDDDLPADTWPEA